MTILFCTNTLAISLNSTENISLNFINSMSNPPYPASNPIPTNNSINIELNSNISWIGGDPDGDPISYNIFWGKTSNPPNVEVVYRANTYNPGPLEYNTQYFWRIDTYADDGGVTNGALWTFITKDDTPPYTPSNPTPSDHSTNIDLNIILSWYGEDPDGDSLTYDVYFGTNMTPTVQVLGQNVTSYTPDLLEYNTNYYWRIVAIDEYGYNTIGPLWTFNTKDDTPPYTPNNPIPNNQSTNISINITFFWTGGDPDNDPVTYDLYLGKDSNPPLEVEDLNVTSYTVESLDFISTYYWRVEAIDEYGYTTIGPLWTFTTRENAPPNIPSEPIPENGSTNIYIDAFLNWQGGDPDNDTVTYDIYFGTDLNPQKVESNISISTYEPVEMNTTTTYYWKIVSWDNYSHSTSSPIWNFKTSIYKNSPPDKPNQPNGPTSGKPGVSYTYSSSTIDSNGEPIFYKFDWDDGTDSGWIGPYNSGQTITTSHIWNSKGNYAVKVKAKDIYGGESFWSDPLMISMPKSTLILQLNIFNYYHPPLKILFNIFINYLIQ